MANGKKWYYEFWMFKKNFDLQTSASGKALSMELRDGHFARGHERTVWFPLSQCKLGEVNEVGNVRVLIPCWIVNERTNYKPCMLDTQYTARIEM